MLLSYLFLYTIYNYVSRENFLKNSLNIEMAVKHNKRPQSRNARMDISQNAYISGVCDQNINNLQNTINF